MVSFSILKLRKTLTLFLSGELSQKGIYMPLLQHESEATLQSLELACPACPGTRMAMKYPFHWTQSANDTDIFFLHILLFKDKKE